MILTCPQCHTRFIVNDAVFGARAREVRCSRCAHQWRAAPPSAAQVAAALAAAAQINATAAPPPAPVVPPAPAPAASEEKITAPPVAEAPAPQAQLPAIAPKPGIGEKLKDILARIKARLQAANRKPAAPFVKPPREKIFGGRLPTGFARQAAEFVLFIAVVAAAGYVGRLALDRAGVEFSLHDLNLFHKEAPVAVEDGLVIQDVRCEQRTEGGEYGLFIHGSIMNGTDHQVVVPELSVEGQDRQGLDRMNWVVEAKDKTLAPGASTTFEASVAGADRSIVGVMVSFVPAAP